MKYGILTKLLIITDNIYFMIRKNTKVLAIFMIIAYEITIVIACYSLIYYP